MSYNSYGSYDSDEEEELVAKYEGQDLTILPPLKYNLKELNCSHNRLSSFSSLGNLPRDLKKLNCSYNLLPSLGGLPALLQELNCSFNSITILPLRLPSSIIDFNCAGNDLTSLPEYLPLSLKIFNCSDNKLTVLPESLTESKVSSLYCGANKLTSLPKMPKIRNAKDGEYNSHLLYLMCEENQLEELPDLPNSLIGLNFANNPLTKFPEIDKIETTKGWRPRVVGYLTISVYQVLILPKNILMTTGILTIVDEKHVYDKDKSIKCFEIIEELKKELVKLGIICKEIIEECHQFNEFIKSTTPKSSPKGSSRSTTPKSSPKGSSKGSSRSTTRKSSPKGSSKSEKIGGSKHKGRKTLKKPSKK